MQFDVAEYSTANKPAAATCAACKRPISQVYYTANEAAICQTCHAQHAAAFAGGSKLKRVFAATGLGLLAGLAGAALWYLVRVAANLQLGLIAIVVGFGVGIAVRKGSQGRGGWFYQTLAIVLTYGCICAQYMPEPLKNAYSAEMDVLGWVIVVTIVFLYSLAAPFLAGIENIIGILIIGIALYEAWRINKRPSIQFAGPFYLKAPAAGAPGT
jgi:hypothetical protein